MEAIANGLEAIATSKTCKKKLLVANSKFEAHDTGSDSHPTGMKGLDDWIESTIVLRTFASSRQIRHRTLRALRAWNWLLSFETAYIR